MKRIIEHVRNKPTEKQNQIIWICAAAVIILMVTLWVFVGSGSRKGDGVSLMQRLSNTFKEANENYKEFKK